MTAARRLAVRANNPVVIVGGILLTCFAMTTYYALRVDDWRVMTDELLYVKLARSIADGFSPVPEVNGEYMAVFSQLFPLLFAPFAGLLSAPDAYEAGHVLNAFLMASTAVPAYLLSRSIGLPQLAGYLVAALTVSVPWLGMATILWTEAVGYPAFLWAIYAIHRGMVTPSVRNDLFVLGGLGLAFGARTQFIFLVAVVPLAILLHEGSYGASGRSASEILSAIARTVRSHLVLAVAYAIIAASAALLALTSGLDEAIGTYQGAASGDLWPEGAWDQIWSHAASVTVAIGVIPAVLAVGWAVASVVRPSSREMHAFAVVVVLAVPILLLIVASFTARYSPNYLQDRYFFYAVPLLFAGMAACLLDPRRRWIGVVAAGIGFFLIADYHGYTEDERTLWFASPSTWFWQVLDGRAGQLGLSAVTVIEVGTLVVTAALAALLRWRPPSRTLLLGATLPVLAFGLAETQYVLNRGSSAGGGGRIVIGNIPLGDRDWVDEALPDDGDVAILPTFLGDDTTTAQRTWWSVDFWNKRITNQFSVQAGGAYTPFPRREMSVDFATGRVDVEGRELPYLVVSQEERRFGMATERSLGTGYRYLELIEPTRPYRAAWTSHGISHDGWTDKGRVRIRLHPDATDEDMAQRVTLTLSAPFLPGNPVPVVRRYRVTGGIGDIAAAAVSGEPREVTVAACPSRRGRAEIELDVSRYSKLSDGRLVGLRVHRVKVVPSTTATCRQTRGA